MNLKPGLCRLDETNADITEAELTALGWSVFSLPGTSIDDRASFFRALKSTIPLDPPLVGDRNLDALSDSLWGGLDAFEGRRVAIVWRDSAYMERANPGEFKTAMKILEDVALSLGDPESTAGAPKEVAIVLA